MSKQDQLDQLFDEFKDEAFRLETLPAYGIPAEASNEARYAAGEPLLDPPQPSAWTNEIREIIESGRRMPHVWLVTEPLTMYQRAGVDWFYPYQAAVGRETYILTPDSPLVDEATKTGDYWMFDSASVALMRYDDTGDFLGTDVLTDPADVAYYVDLRDRLLATAQPFRQWLAGWRQRVR